MERLCTVHLYFSIGFEMRNLNENKKPILTAMEWFRMIAAIDVIV